MKKNHFKPSTFNFQLILLLLLAACHSPDNKHQTQSVLSDLTLDSQKSLAMDEKLPAIERARICENISYALIYEDIEQAISFAELGLGLSKNEKGAQKDSLTAMLNCNLGVCYALNQVFDTAKLYFDEALQYAINAKDEDFEIYLYNAYGKLYSDQGSYMTSVEYFEKARQLAEKKEHYQYLALLLCNIGKLYFYEENFQQAENYLSQATELYNTKFQNHSEDIFSDISDAYITLSMIWNVQGRFEESYSAANKALEYAQLSNYKYFEAKALLLFPYVYCHLKNYDKALEIAYRTLELAKELDDKILKADCFHALGFCYYQTGNDAKSKTYYLQSLAFIAPNDLVRRRNTSKALFDVLVRLKETDKLLSVLNMYDSINIAINSQRIQSTIFNLRIRYEIEKKELEIKHHQSIILRQVVQRNVFVAGIVILFVFLFLLWRLFRLGTKHNRSLTEANATKDKFFSIISHDLKNPAASLRDALILLAQNTGLWDAGTLANYANELVKLADGNVELLNSLLNWAKIQTGRFTYNPGTFVFSNLIPNISLIRNIAEKKGITLIVNIPENAFVTADSNILITVIRNLLANAVKFTSAGGTVRLDVVPTTPSFGHPSKGGEFSTLNSQFLISVTDTGTGMSPEQIRNLFRLDKHQSSPGTAGEEGSGLGLIVCKDLLAKHGSELQVESEKGKGSRFCFSI